jgi:hypothetical protein
MKKKEQVTHFVSEDMDTDIACDIIGETPDVTCLECLGGQIAELKKQLVEARHHLAMTNPEGWSCLPDCSYCNSGW